MYINFCGTNHRNLDVNWHYSISLAIAKYNIKSYFIKEEFAKEVLKNMKYMRTAVGYINI